MFISYLRFAFFAGAHSSSYWTKRHYLRVFVSVGVLLIASFTTALAQSSPPANTTATAGWTPLSLQPGAPAGSYPLGDFDNVNLFNGHLNFRLPLMQIGGRGRAGYTMLPIEQNWNVQTVAVPTCNQSGCTYSESNIVILQIRFGGLVYSLVMVLEFYRVDSQEAMRQPR